MAGEHSLRASSFCSGELDPEWLRASTAPSSRRRNATESGAAGAKS